MGGLAKEQGGHEGEDVGGGAAMTRKGGVEEGVEERDVLLINFV